MADNLRGIPFSNDDEGQSYPEIAKDLVYEQARSLVQEKHPTFSRDEVYVVWFVYVLGAWKALCSTSLPDGRYYEVTYHAQKRVAFVDTYMKTHNVEVTFP
jgi:Family of unknown function (DUF6275)